MLFLPQVSAFLNQPRLYEILKSLIDAVNNLGRQIGVDPVPAAAANPDREITSTTIIGGVSLPSDGNEGEILTFRKDAPTGVAWEGPHEIDTFVSGVF